MVLLAAMARNGRGFVSPSLIKWKPVFIEKFDLGIGEEWLPRVGSGNCEAEPNSNELSDMTSDVTEWLSSLPDVQTVMNFNEDFVTASQTAATMSNQSNTAAATEHSSDKVVTVTKQMQLSLRTKKKGTEKRSLMKRSLLM